MKYIFHFLKKNYFSNFKIDPKKKNEYYSKHYACWMVFFTMTPRVSSPLPFSIYKHYNKILGFILEYRIKEDNTILRPPIIYSGNN